MKKYQLGAVIMGVVLGLSACGAGSQGGSMPKAEDKPAMLQMKTEEKMPGHAADNMKTENMSDQKMNDKEMMNQETGTKTDEQAMKEDKDGVQKMDAKEMKDQEMINDSKMTDDKKMMNDPKMSDDKGMINDQKMTDDKKMMNDPKMSDDKKMMNDQKMTDDKKMMNDKKMTDDKAMMNDNKMTDDKAMMNDNKMSDDKKMMNDKKMDDDQMMDDSKKNDGEMAADFTLKDKDDNEFSLASVKGKKVYVKFWASWCSICLAGLEELNTLAGKDKDFEIVTVVSPGVRGEKSKEEFIKWFDTLGYSNVKVLFDEEGKVGDAYGVRAYPTSAFIGSDGVLAKLLPGHAGSEQIEKIFEDIK